VEYCAEGLTGMIASKSMKMNKALIVLVLCLQFLLTKAQTYPWTLNLYGGYTFKDKVELYDTHAYINEGFQYGAGLEYHFDAILAMELKYLRMDTEVPLYKNGVGNEQVNPDSSKASINHIFLSTNLYMENDKAKVLPFGSLGVGVGIADAKKGGSVTKFAWDIEGGLIIRPHSSLSFKLLAYLRSISGGYGGTFYMGSGGAIYGNYTYASIWQFGLGGALCFNLGSKSKF
jgi:opacity protein-like surface antigen